MPFSDIFRRQPPATVVATSGPELLTPADVRDAYERGRRDALKSRKRHPAGTTFLFAAAAAGVAVLAYATYSGSFGQGGQRIDRDLASAAENAKPIVRGAAHDAGEAVRRAGQPQAPK